MLKINFLDFWTVNGDHKIGSNLQFSIDTYSFPSFQYFASRISKISSYWIFYLKDLNGFLLLIDFFLIEVHWFKCYNDRLFTLQAAILSKTIMEEEDFVNLWFKWLSSCLNLDLGNYFLPKFIAELFHSIFFIDFKPQRCYFCFIIGLFSTLSCVGEIMSWSFSSHWYPTHCPQYSHQPFFQDVPS